MRAEQGERSSPRPDLVLLGGLYLLEISALLVAIFSFVRHTGDLGGERGTVVFLWSPVPFLMLALILLGGAIILVAQRCRQHFRRESRRLWMTLTLNVIPALVVVIVGELAVRLLAVPSAQGLAIRDTVLLPRQWENVVARNRAALDRLPPERAYLVYDELLGWTVGASRASEDGLYFSSVEGLRSPGPGVVLAAHRPRYRVALVGDSFTFGLDVKYEESWGYHLERALGDDIQVLNFGVNGYGVDQAYLRYERDARRWQPDVVVLGLINHDLFRSLAVYPFLSFPEWSIPFAKPRFIDEGDGLALGNVPLLSPSAILAKRSIMELPLLEYEPTYRAEEWEWRVCHLSYLCRLITGKLVAKLRPGPRGAEEATVRVNTRILRAFVDMVAAAGAAPLVVYFPSRRDFRALANDPVWTSLAQQILNSNRIPHADVTPCVAALTAADRFVEGLPHYSPRANLAVADCLRARIQALLSERGRRTSERPRAADARRLGGTVADGRAQDKR